MEKKRYYKNGDPELFNYFSEDEIKDWTDKEKAMWHPYSDVEQAPIPQDVIEFQNKQLTDAQDELDLKAKEIADLKQQLEKNEKTTYVEPPKTAHDDLGEDQKEQLTEDQQRKLVMEELRKLDVRFAPNSKLSTLQRKLKEAQDAND